MNASDQVTDYIAGLKDWRGELLARIRQIVREEAPNAVEEWKWNSPVWSDHGLFMGASAFKSHVGVNFFHGASLPDPDNVLVSTDAKQMRSLKLTKADTLNEPALRGLIRAAVAHNAA